MPCSLVRGQKEKGCEALLFPKREDRLPSGHFKPCLYYHIIWIFYGSFAVFSLCLRCKYYSIRQVITRTYPGRPALETPVRILLFLSCKQSQANDLLILKRFIQQHFVLRPHYKCQAYENRQYVLPL